MGDSWVELIMPWPATIGLAKTARTVPDTTRRPLLTARTLREPATSMTRSSEISARGLELCGCQCAMTDNRIVYSTAMSAK